MRKSLARNTTYQSLDIILSRATKEQRISLVGWIAETSVRILEEQAKGKNKCEGISPANYWEWLELAEKQWGKPKRERPARENPNRPKLVLLQGGVR